MSYDCGLIYRTSRKSAGLFQDDAAALLHYSTRRLSSWENGDAIPPEEAVAAMATLYQDDGLLYQHLVQKRGIRHILPSLDKVTLAESAVDMEHATKRIKEVATTIMMVAGNRQIDRESIPRLVADLPNIEMSIKILLEAKMLILSNAKKYDVDVDMRQDLQV